MFQPLYRVENVLFESEEKDISKITRQLEVMLTKTFKYKSRVVVRSHKQMKDILADAQRDWNTRKDIRCYIGFLAESVTEEEIKKVRVREGVDTLKVKPGVLYMTSLLSALTKSAFNKIPATKIYQDMTIRNYNTAQKILSLMDED